MDCRRLQNNLLVLGNYVITGASGFTELDSTPVACPWLFSGVTTPLQPSCPEGVGGAAVPLVPQTTKPNHCHCPFPPVSSVFATSLCYLLTRSGFLCVFQFIHNKEGKLSKLTF